jgi:hypothetical protein
MIGKQRVQQKFWRHTETEKDQHYRCQKCSYSFFSEQGFLKLGCNLPLILQLPNFNRESLSGEDITNPAQFAINCQHFR